MGILRDVQNEQKAWLEHNFPHRRPEHQLLGLVEEIGELAHARLKREQGIRGAAEHWTAKEKDAVGDILIFLLGHCNENNWDLEEILLNTWGEVKCRDWKRYPKTGLPPE